MDEELREALLEVSNARERERRTRAELDAVIDSLHRLVEATDAPSLFHAVVEASTTVLSAEGAALFFLAADGTYQVHTSTHAALRGVRIVAQATFERVLQGRTIPAFDLTRIPEWTDHRPEGMVSGLHVPLLTESRTGILVLLHSKRGYFTRSHVQQVARIRPLMLQALLNADALDLRERRVARELRDLARFPQENPMPVLRLQENRLAFANPAASGLLSQLSLRVGERVDPTIRDALLSDGPLETGNHTYALLTSETVRGDINVYAFDITARTQAERKLRESQAQLSSLIQSSTDPIWSVRPDGSIETYNFAFAELMRAIHIDPGPALHLSDLPDASRLHQGLNTCLTGAGAELEWHPDETRTVELQMSPTRSGSMSLGATIVARDVSERVEAARQLRRAQEEAEQANAAKTTFLAQMSHEIRTPLNAILGMTDLARSTTGAEQRGMLDRVQVNAEALLHLVSDLLDVSKIEAGQLDIDLRPFQPATIIQQVTGYLAQRADQKGLFFELELDPIPRLRGDADRFRQLATNLIGNAIKYTESGGVTVRLRHGTDLVLEVEDTGIGIAPHEQERIFDRFYRAHRPSRSRVATGTGLGLSIVRSLAELMGGRVALQSTLGVGSTFTLSLPFALADQPAPAALHLSGVVVGDPDVASTLQELGCTVTTKEDCRSLLLSLLEPGTPPEFIWFGQPSDPEFETTIRLIRGVERFAQTRLVTRGDTAHAETTPAGRGPYSTHALAGLLAQPKAPRRRLCRGAHVLVVDDNPDNLAVTRRFLQRAGHTVTLADGGVAGVAAALQNRFDLIVMDIDMPDVDGFEATAQIRAEETLQEWPRVPIVALTAHATETVRRRAMNVGMDDFLAKPVSDQRLDQTVRALASCAPRVLLVDDSLDARVLAERWLSDAGADVVTADDGPTALAKLRTDGPFDLVITDLDMPDVDGWAVTEAARPSPAMIVSGHADAATRAKAEARGLAYLVKPITRDTLTGAVDGLLLRPIPTEQPPPQVIDPDIADLVPVFIDSRRADLARVADDLANGDWDAVRRMGHSLKGTAPSFGFPALGTLGRQLEAAAKAQDPDAVDRSVTAIAKAIASIAKAVGHS